MFDNEPSSYRSSVNAVQYLKRRLSPQQTVHSVQPTLAKIDSPMKAKPPKAKPLVGVIGTQIKQQRTVGSPGIETV